MRRQESTSNMPLSRSLNSIQKWMQTVITHPDGVGAGVASSDAVTLLDVASDDVERVVLPSREMGSLDRLQIYGRAYFGRLLECLRAQFPAVRHALGDEAFDGLAFGYLVDHPSTRYTLAPLGSSFDAYLLATRPARAKESDPSEPDFADFLIDLTRLERIYGEVFDGPGPERSRSLESPKISGLSPQDFANSRLILHSCVRLLELRFPVHEYATAIRNGQEPPPPIARPIYLAVTRRDYVVRRYEITSQQFQLLSALERQATIGEAIQTLYTDAAFDVSSLRFDLQSWFHDWSAAPLFAELTRDVIA